MAWTSNITTFDGNWGSAHAGEIRDILSVLCKAINKREILLGKIQSAAEYGPWLDARVNSGGLFNDKETWTNW